MKRLLDIVPILLFAGIVFLTPPIVENAKAIQQNKADIGEISHIYYGIFNVNTWKRHVSGIIYSEINKLDIKATAKELKKTVEDQLTTLVDTLNAKVKEANKDSFTGKIKQLFINAVVDIEAIKKDIPVYADTLIAEMTKPETEKQLKEMATREIKTYLSKTFKNMDTKKIEAVLKRTESKTIEEAREKLTKENEKRLNTVEQNIIALVALAIILFLWAALTRSFSSTAFFTLFPTLLVMLYIGVATPMIDLDAKIAEMSFQLLGHKISFENQVLYFQSKSVLDVFEIMITHSDLKMKFVGVLLVLFSIVIPILKLFSSLLHYASARLRKNRIIYFFAFHSGKWSMADVLVIAIFMAYIGFNGIVTSQFKKMADLVPDQIVFITTNGTSLQPGFYVFLSYVLLALALSAVLHLFVQAKINRTKKPTVTEEDLVV